MKSIILAMLGPSLALAAGSNITTTCQSVSIDSSSGVLSALCNSTASQYFSQLDLNQCLGWNTTFIAEANGNFAQSCSSLAVVNTPKANTLDASCGATSTRKATSFDLTTLVTNNAGCLACLSASSSFCTPSSGGFGVGPGSTGSGSGTGGGSSFGGSGTGSSGSTFGSGSSGTDSSMSGQNSGSSSTGFKGSRRFRA